jgi:hypothetical protein
VAHVSVLKPRGLGEVDEEVRKVRAVPRVVAAVPVILGLGLAKSAGGSQFITLKGASIRRIFMLQGLVIGTVGRSWAPPAAAR